MNLIDFDVKLLGIDLAKYQWTVERPNCLSEGMYTINSEG